MRWIANELQGDATYRTVLSRISNLFAAEVRRINIVGGDRKEV